MKVRCPKCKTVYSVNKNKINFDKRRLAKCIHCESLFYIEKHEEVLLGDQSQSKVSFLHSYFEKRKYPERRKGTDRRNKIEKNDFPFTLPEKDFIPIFNNKGQSVGFYSHGRRNGGDRRTGIDRRKSLM